MLRTAPCVNARGDTNWLEQAAGRRIPAVLVVDAFDRAVMANEQTRAFLSECEQVDPPVSDFCDLPPALKAAVADLRRILEERPERSAFTQLSADLCVRACRLSSAFGTYLLLSIERLRRNNPTLLNLQRHRLSPRESQAVLLVLQGMTNRSIANRLYISKSTVEAYLKHIYAKVDVHSRAALVAKILGPAERW